jgi:hypothetical protein
MATEEAIRQYFEAIHGGNWESFIAGREQKCLWKSQPQRLLESITVPTTLPAVWYVLERRKNQIRRSSFTPHCRVDC